jgi:uncharacterized membrane protein YccC
VFFVAAGGQLLAWGEDPPDSAYYTFFAVLMAAILAWSALNLALLAWRGRRRANMCSDTGSPPKTAAVRTCDRWSSAGLR